MCSYHRHNIRFQDIVCLKLKLNGQDIKKYQQKGHNLIKCELIRKQEITFLYHVTKCPTEA